MQFITPSKHDRSLYWLGTGTSINSMGVQLDLWAQTLIIITNVHYLGTVTLNNKVHLVFLLNGRHYLCRFDMFKQASMMG